MLRSFKIMAAAGLAVFAANAARACEPCTPYQPASDYATITPNNGNAMDVTVKMTKRGFGISMAAIAGDTPTAPVSVNLTKWAPQGNPWIATWGVVGSGKVIVAPGQSGLSANPTSGRFVATAALPKCQPHWVVYLLRIMDLKTGCKFWGYSCGKSVNVPPVAIDDCDPVTLTNGNTPVVINVLANDYDANGDKLTVVSVTKPKHGKATINSNGTITYVPALNYSGSDEFSYTISDGRGGCSTACVCVAVGNIPPVAKDDCTTDVVSGKTATINVLANDTDANHDVLTVVAVTNPAHGVAVINADGTITYTANAGYVGGDSFSYTISDGQGGCATASVCLNVTAPVDDCSGILLFGPDINREIYDYLVNDANGPHVPASAVTLVNSGGVYDASHPNPLTEALDAKLAADGKPFCTILFDTEFVGDGGAFTGLSAADQARLKTEILNGAGFVYAEPADLGADGISKPSTPDGQLPGVLPVEPLFFYDHTEQFQVNDTFSPLTAGLPAAFNAASAGQDTQLTLEAPVPGVSYSMIDYVYTSTSNLGYGIPGLGGATVITLQYNNANTGIDGGRVALIGTDPYDDGTQATDFASINRLYYNALMFTGHFDNGIVH